MPLFWLSLAFLFGILLGEFVGWPPIVWWALTGLAALWLVIRWLLSLRSRQSPPVVPSPSGQPSPNPFFTRLSIPLPLLLVFVALGAARSMQAQPQFNPGFIAWYNGLEPESTVVGVLTEPPDRRDTYTNLRVQAEQVGSQEGLALRPVQGLLLAKVETAGNWRYGDRIRLQGALQVPPQEETFSYRDYLAIQGIYAYMPQARPALRKAARRIGSWTGSIA